MRTILLTTVAAVLLQGCFAVFVPGSVVGSVSDSLTGNQGQNCIGDSSRVGDRIRLNDGRIGTVVKIEGASSRCTDARYPLRALLTFE